MPAALVVTNGDIEYAEGILLPAGMTFDDERRAFIRNFETIDLQAVPGSGKTTALLAKLLIIEKHLPLNDGSGVLVLSHTNAAVDEIKNAIGIHCPKLFAYPNYVGTIQSFTDKFLAIPYGHNCLGVRFDRVDSEAFSERLWKNFRLVQQREDFGSLGKWFYGMHIATAKEIAGENKPEVRRLCNALIEAHVKNIRYDYNEECFRNGIDGKALLKSKTNPKFNALLAITQETFAEGYLSFDYAYILAKHYLILVPELTPIVRKRFPYVFVDEMQDMDPHQYTLLETLFAPSGPHQPIYQRIGDKNQAIYEGLTGEIWQDRAPDRILSLKGSYRLSSQVAKVVQPFALTPIAIDGRRELRVPIKPCLLVYTEPSHVINEYIRIIRTHVDSGAIPSNTANGFHAICWVTKEKETETTLSRYFADFKRVKQESGSNYYCLRAYFDAMDPVSQCVRAIRSHLINAILKVLRLEDIRDENNRYYTQARFLRQLNQLDLTRDTKYSDEFNFQLFQWCSAVANGKTTEALRDLRIFLPNLLGWLDKTLTKADAITFVNADSASSQSVGENTSESRDVNVAIEPSGDIRIEVSNVHAVKGHTHTATLYMESFYQKMYESSRLPGPFLNGSAKIKGTYQNETARLLYVGFSRPTHLLCFAVHKERFEAHLSAIDRDIWEIVEVS
ncbi:MAG: UvrD-helicase domain-containing protein [Bacteroidota bacterium]|nr:UvrD-helicase domain-containing protein [Bacteroidota bacterium]MDP4233421.1 UvrD-helicase domain-containing protein [Bacteroidota bacterium]MDP4242287.1 UvrD-helicase domain-containing protein [Bacteroidota bacterium]MDP4287043.1 UvrD-helicase domain-containing protein [Bacteroidota bacterium]